MEDKKPASAANTALIHGGKDYFSLLVELINKAKEVIHFQTYIFDDDETGQQVANALKEAAKRKVEVYLLVDGYASQVMSQKFIDELRDTGICFRFFQPLWKSKHFYLGRRLHHKIFVADDKHALVGGINVTNKYNDIAGEPAWLDFALHMQGGTPKELAAICKSLWEGPSKKRRSAITPATQTTNTPDKTIVIRRNDWVRKKKEIHNSYLAMFRNAKSEVTILCSYFLPGKKIRWALSNAAKRGVKIRVIAAGKSDVMTAKRAERWLYDWLLRHKVEIYEYQPTVIHAKLATCDSEWMTIGSYNINNISAYASIELNIEVHEPGLTKETESMLDALIKKDCKRITMERHKRSRNVFKQLNRWIAYQFIRVMFHLFTFYFKQRG